MSIARHPLLESFDNGASLIDDARASRVESCVQHLVAHEHGKAMIEDRAFNNDNFWPPAESWEARYRPYVVKDGVLHIPVKGVLLHDFGYAVGDWVTGYVYIQRAFERGCVDFAAGLIKGIAFIADTPGGMVAGCFDAVDKMYALKLATGVPVRAFAHEGAYSAGYAIIGGVADDITVSRTGGVGSIGVVTSHIDASGMMEQRGLRRTWIFKGAHKVDGNSDGPLPEEVKARWLTRITESYEVFVSTVARNRSQLSEEAVRETEALTFTATQALSNGLADHIGSLDDALAAYAADLSSHEGDDEMSTQDTAAQSQAAIDQARTDGHAAGLAEGTVAGQKAAVDRINAILGSDEAKVRPKAALSAALKTGMSADEAKAFLGDLPEEAAQTAAPVAAAVEDTFEASMEATPNPDLGANGGKKKEQDAVTAEVDDLRALAVGVGLKGYTAPAGK
jgi:ClpP class serine protease